VVKLIWTVTTNNKSN